MNQSRRKKLHLVLDGLDRLRDPIDKEDALSILNDAQRKVEQCMDEEDDALNNRPESFRFSAANTDLEDNVSDLSDANDELEILVEQCGAMEMFHYDLIKDGILIIVRAINQAISR